MSKEAMKLALEALEDTLSDDPYPYSLESKAITALREALAEQPAQQETIKQGWDVDTILDKPKQPAPCEPADDGVCEALDCSNHKPAQQEPVACANGCRGFVKHSPPAQRTWVGLTDDEMIDLQDRCGLSIHRSDFSAIEAKLKEKNT